MTNKEINGYRIIRKIGEGGMGEVYFAQDSLGQNAAIKVLREEYRNRQDLKERFITEIKAMIILQGHPNIVELKSTTNISDPVIIMEYLEGEDLYSYVKKRKEPVNESVLILWIKQIVSALQYAHSKQIIHRDIKPSNIFLTKFGKIKVLDFGIAKVIQQTEDGHVDSTLLETLTKTRSNLGAPQFMSPEQSFDPKLVTGLSDIFSFGKTLNYLSTGGGNPTIKPSVNIDKIIRKCTEQNPDDRFQTWEEILDILPKEKTGGVQNTLLPTQTKETATLQITTTLDCRVIMNGVEIGEAKKGETFCKELRYGKYQFDFIAQICNKDKISRVVEMSQSNKKPQINVDLNTVRERRLENARQNRELKKHSTPSSHYSASKSSSESSNSSAWGWIATPGIAYLLSKLIVSMFS